MSPHLPAERPDRRAPDHPNLHPPGHPLPRLLRPLAAIDDRLRRAGLGLPAALLPLAARVAMAATFWRSGQTKVEGFALDLVEGRVELGWPRLSATAVELFRDEYRLPLLPPETAALLAAGAEHLLPVLLLAGLATRLSALGLLGMTAVIQLLVYPGAWPVHLAWAALLAGLWRHGGGALSLDHLLLRRPAGTPADEVPDLSRTRTRTRTRDQDRDRAAGAGGRHGMPR